MHFLLLFYKIFRLIRYTDNVISTPNHSEQAGTLYSILEFSISINTLWAASCKKSTRKNNYTRKNNSTRKQILQLKMCFLVELFFLVDLFFLMDFYMKRPYMRKHVLMMGLAY